MSIARIAAKSLLALAALLFGVHAQAADLNFASLSQPGSSYTPVGSSVTQQGFTVAGTSLYVWEASSPSLPSVSIADTSLFDFYPGAGDSLTAAGNVAFTLNSIDNIDVTAAGTSATPEPSTLLLLGSCLVGIAGMARRASGLPAKILAFVPRV